MLDLVRLLENKEHMRICSCFICFQFFWCPFYLLNRKQDRKKNSDKVAILLNSQISSFKFNRQKLLHSFCWIVTIFAISFFKFPFGISSTSNFSDQKMCLKTLVSVRFWCLFFNGSKLHSDKDAHFLLARHCEPICTHLKRNSIT